MTRYTLKQEYFGNGFARDLLTSSVTVVLEDEPSIGELFEAFKGFLAAAGYAQSTVDSAIVELAQDIALAEEQEEEDEEDDEEEED